MAQGRLHHDVSTCQALLGLHFAGRSGDAHLPGAAQWIAGDGSKWVKFECPEAPGLGAPKKGTKLPDLHRKRWERDAPRPAAIPYHLL